ncbi:MULTISPECIES: LysR substrate-binding domain-containing protein [Agrobacterium tumefaciens complex]|uniref:LysR substrate-binding domain-containing protein n=1 Tax=Agrobacterium tumefaciens complex TaxID=1183400 RepID=UPI0001FC21C7|nr:MULTISPECIES: LysR substrate-binding domain-containing protein [Agrobacterium tumefaciens complex]ADY67810.1 hypothetical protein AGROH133_14318 [Agrobacterium tumefaciens]EPR23452.1 hypothetical protein L902_00710 [Agrobacterium radiobacter DSM 30147]KAB0459225.1 hypothetical protein F7R04_15670 [Agrobacterium tumefaciens]KWT75429.1 hypothetical protein ASH09_19085 [Agrobacterium radiobacter]NIB11641.1 hypothetical protein [Agrobacterium radiobacter]
MSAETSISPSSGASVRASLLHGIVVNDRRAALQLAIDGLGITFCIEDTVTELIEAGKLVPLLLEWSKPFPGFFVSYSRQRHMAVATRVVINKIRAGNP